MPCDIASLRFPVVNRSADAWVSSGGIRVPAPSPYHPTDCRSHRNGPGYGQSHPPNYTLPSTPPVPRTPTPPRSASGSFRRSRPTATPHRPPEKPTGESLIRALPCLGISRNLGSSPARLRMRHQGRCRSVRWLPGIPVKASLWHRLSPLQIGDDDPHRIEDHQLRGALFPSIPMDQDLETICGNAASLSLMPASPRVSNFPLVQIHLHCALSKSENGQRPVRQSAHRRDL